jgi:hypothetical protein
VNYKTNRMSTIYSLISTMVHNTVSEHEMTEPAFVDSNSTFDSILTFAAQTA